MANICYSNITIITTKSERKEILNAFESGAIRWTYGINKNDFDKSLKSFSYETKWSPIPLQDGSMEALSEAYPTVIFYYEYDVEGCSEEEQIWFCNGVDWYDFGWVPTVRYEAYDAEVNRFASATKKSAKGILHSVEIKPDKRVVADGENRFGECDVLLWKDVKTISCGNWHTVGLQENGTLLACGSNANGQCDVADIEGNIVDISCGRYHTAVLLDNGKVVIKGTLQQEVCFEEDTENFDYIQTNIESWPPVVKILSIFDAVAGITSDDELFVDGFCPCTKEEIVKAIKCPDEKKSELYNNDDESEDDDNAEEDDEDDVDDVDGAEEEEDDSDEDEDGFRALSRYMNHNDDTEPEKTEATANIRYGIEDEEEAENRDDDEFAEEVDAVFPMIKSIEGTAYEGRIARIEYIQEGDSLILKADYNNRFYDPVAIEVFNTKNETLGYLCNDFGGESLSQIAKHIDKLKARVSSVTPLSRRRKNAKYALMDVELYIDEENVFEDEGEDDHKNKSYDAHELLNARGELLDYVKTLNCMYEQAQLTDESPYSPRMKQILNEYKGEYNEDSNTIVLKVESKGLDYEGRDANLKKVELGNELQIVREPTNDYNSNNFAIMINKKSLGNLPAELCDALAPLYDTGHATISSSKASYIEQSNGEYYHTAVLFVEMEIKLTPINCLSD